ncbi:Protein of unknown function, partial [Gryllus bimaculatus]
VCWRAQARAEEEEEEEEEEGEEEEARGNRSRLGPATLDLFHALRPARSCELPPPDAPCSTAAAASSSTITKQPAVFPNRKWSADSIAVVTAATHKTPAASIAAPTPVPSSAVAATAASAKRPTLSLALKGQAVCNADHTGSTVSAAAAACPIGRNLSAAARGTAASAPAPSACAKAPPASTSPVPTIGERCAGSLEAANVTAV